MSLLVLPEDNRPVLLVTATALLVRLINLPSESITTDVMRSIELSSMPLLELYSRYPGFEPHPPLYYTFLHFWIDIFGTGVLAIRAPSVVFGTITVLFTYLFIKQWGGTRAAVIGAGFVLLSPQHVYWSQTARMYALMTAAGAISLYYFARLYDGELSKSVIAAYLASSVILFYSHVFGSFILLAEGLFFIGVAAVSYRTGRMEKRIWATGGALLGVLIGIVPWMAVVVHDLLLVQSGGGPAVTWIDPFTPKLFFSSLARYLGFQFFEPWAGVAAIGAVSFGVAALVTRNKRPLAYFGLAGATPLLTPAILSVLVMPLFLAKYAMGCLMGVGAVLGIGGDELFDRNRTVALVMCVTIVAGMGLGLGGLYTDDQNRQYDEAAAVIEQEGSGGELVVNDRNHDQTAIGYYLSGSDFRVESAVWSPTASEVQDIVDGEDTFWVVVNSRSDREFIEGLSADRERIYYKEFNGMELYRYR